MKRYGASRAWLGGGVLALVVATMIAAVPAVPTVEDSERVVETGPVVVSPLSAEAVEASSAGVEDAPAEEVAAEAAARVAEPAVLETQIGSASYYANMLAGRRTASGVRYDPTAAVAAHRHLPFGTRLRVHNLSNGRAVEVEVVDRGPFAKGRILDLSRWAARELGFIRQGHTRVRIEVLEYGE